MAPQDHPVGSSSSMTCKDAVKTLVMLPCFTPPSTNCIKMIHLKKNLLEDTDVSIVEALDEIVATCKF